MFFSTEMLSKRGPLAKVWLAAHVERKVSKAQTLQTSIPTTVTVILEPASTSVSTPPLALRLSGQLLLGIARIYSKQAKYLLEDCNEASDKIRAAFRSDGIQVLLNDNLSGAGDDHLFLQNAANPNTNIDAINLRATTNRNFLEFDLDFGIGGDRWDDFDKQLQRGLTPPLPGFTRSKIDADIGDITLAEPHSVLGIINQSDLGLDELGGGDAGLLGDGEGFDLGLDLDGLDEPRQTKGRREARESDERMDLDLAGDETIEMEIGRDAPGTADRRSARDSILPGGFGGDLSADKTFDTNLKAGDISLGIENERIVFENQGGGQNDFFPENFGDQNLDLGLDLGAQDVNMADPDAPQQGQVTPRGVTPAPDLNRGDLTPRASNQDQNEEGDAIEKVEPPKKRPRHQLVDRTTELDPADQPSSSLVPGTTPSTPTSSRSRFLPKDRYQMEYYRLSLDPSHHNLLPKLLEADGQNWLMAAPVGLCKELQDLFRFPANAKASRIDSGKKRDREDDLQREEDILSEQGRRAQSLANQEGDEGFGRVDVGDGTFDFGGGAGEESGMMFGGQDEFQLEIPEAGQDQYPEKKGTNVQGEGEELGKETEVSKDVAHLAEKRVERRNPRVDGETSKLDLFDEPGNTQLTQATENESERITEPGATKWSKNTVKALTVLRDELSEDQVMEFKDVAQKATRKASSSFFFELLVLATRDCLKLEQEHSYGEIKVNGRDRLWNVIDQEGLRV